MNQAVYLASVAEGWWLLFSCLHGPGELPLRRALEMLRDAWSHGSLDHAASARERERLMLTCICALRTVLGTAPSEDGALVGEAERQAEEWASHPLLSSVVARNLARNIAADLAMPAIATVAGGAA